MRLIPATWKGKLRALAILPVALLAIYVGVTVVFWSFMSFVLAALFALYGALITVLAVLLAAYAVWRRAKLGAFRRGWSDGDSGPKPAQG